MEKRTGRLQSLIDLDVTHSRFRVLEKENLEVSSNLFDLFGNRVSNPSDYKQEQLQELAWIKVLQPKVTPTPHVHKTSESILSPRLRNVPQLLAKFSNYVVTLEPTDASDYVAEYYFVKSPGNFYTWNSSRPSNFQVFRLRDIPDGEYWRVKILSEKPHTVVKTNGSSKLEYLARFSPPIVGQEIVPVHELKKYLDKSFGTK